MEITQTPAAFTSNTPAANANSPVALTSDFNTFLRMLTVQMQNQDPLNPIESSDYAVQLATFSGVEQQVQTNDLLRTLGGQMGVAGLSDLAGWVGREIRAPTSVEFDGTPITLSTPVVTGATAAEVVVRDDLGREVQRLAIDPQDQQVDWAGVTADGFPLPSGAYRFDVVSYDGEAVLSDAPAEVYNLVTEVRIGPQGAMLVLSNGDEIAASEATALRAAAPS